MLRPLAALIFLLALTPMLHAEQIVDDFESYKDAQVIGPSADSKPWRRFGNATNDHVVATTQKAKVLAGAVSAQYGVRWPARFGAARYIYAQPANLSTFRALALTLRSAVKDSSTTLRLALDDGETTFLSKKNWPVTDQPTTYCQEFKADQFERVAGKGAFDKVLASVQSLGFNVANERKADAPELNELLLFDSLRLLAPGDELPKANPAP